MQIGANNTFMALVASLVVAIAPAMAQPDTSVIEQVLESGISGASVVEPAPEPITAHSSAPSHNVIDQPPVCRIRSDEECHHAAAACLKARSIAGLYTVGWGREGKPAILRVRDDMTEAQEKHARACATDLKQCLSGNC